MQPRPPLLSESAARQQVIDVCRRLYERGLIAAGDGNVSVKLDSERVLVTPSGFHKGLMKPEDLIITDLQGRRLKGLHKPSSEFLMHAQCYAERPDIHAVVHAHPPMTVALALAGVTLSQCVLSETCLLIGPILTAPYSTPTTDEVPRVLQPYLRQANAVVLEGAEQFNALDRMGTTLAAAVVHGLELHWLNVGDSRVYLCEDGRMMREMYLFEVKKPSESKYPWDYYKLKATIPADQAYRPLSVSSCPLVKK